MMLSDAIKTALRHRQSPMTPQQIAYFISFNHLLYSTSGLPRMVRAVEEAVYQDPGTFTVQEDLVYMSQWSQQEQEIVQRVYSQVQQATGLFRELGHNANCCNNMVLALLLYKRLSDIERSQQLGAPIIPRLWKFNRVASDTMLPELSARVYEVMDYVERTDERLAHTFMYGKEELIHMSDTTHLRKLQEVMRMLAALQLDEEHVPTPLFQAIFSRLFWNNVRHTSKALAEEV